LSLSIYLPSFSADQPRQLGGIRLHDYSYIPPRAAVIALGFFLAIGCGDPVDRDIATLIKDGDAGQEAKISLNMAQGYAVAPIIAAIRNREHPVRARVDLVEALYRLHLREKSPGAFDGLVEGLADPTPEVRAACARVLGNVGDHEAIDYLLAAFEKETDARVQLETLRTFVMMSIETINSNNPTIDVGRVIGAEEMPRFTRALQAVETEDDSLQAAKQEWLENIAETMAMQARRSLLTGNLDAAEQELIDALALVPESPNINFQLGKFYYENGQPQKGLDLIDRVGLMAYATRLDKAPIIDGDLDEAVWSEVEPLTRFYQLLQRMNAYPAQGKSEAYIGYHQQTLYIGVKGYEPRTDNLSAERTRRDDSIWRDDCVEIYLDTDHDSRTYYQLDVNSLGAFDDIHYELVDGFPEVDFDWNAAEIKIAALIAETFWSFELKVPIAELHNRRVEPGDTWGFNLAQVRITNISESAQWAPTYGWSQQPSRFGFLVFK